MSHHVPQLPPQQSLVPPRRGRTSGSMRCAMPCAVRCEWAQCSEREGNTSWAVRLAGRGCVSDTRPPGVTCNVTDTSDRWRPAALEIVWGHAALGWARECPRIHVSNMRIAHGWGTQQAAVASRHSGGVIGLAAGRETRGTAAADAHGVAGDRAGPNRGRPSRRGRRSPRENPLDRRVSSPSQRYR